MKKLLLVLILVATLFLIGCIPNTDILEAEFTITKWEQDVYCDGKIYKAVNGETRCGCDSCCPECPICECPTCTCCCDLEWGNRVYIDYKVENIGNVDISYEIYFTITFRDNTEYKGCVAGYAVLVGEELFEQAEIYVPNKRVVFVKIDSYELEPVY